MVINIFLPLSRSPPGGALPTSDRSCRPIKLRIKKMGEQYAQQVMTKEARDQEVERQHQRKYFHEARLARFDADHTMHQADKRQHESVEMKFEAIKASFSAKRAEVGSRIEEIGYKVDLQIEQ